MNVLASPSSPGHTLIDWSFKNVRDKDLDELKELVSSSQTVSVSLAFALHGAGCESVSSFFSHVSGLSSLRSLCLEGNRLSPSAWPQLSPALCSFLHHLDVSGCMMGDSSFHILLSSTSSSSCSLFSLRASSNHLVDVVCVAGLTQLHHLDLSCNPQLQCHQLVDVIRNMNSLNTLMLHHTPLDDAHVVDVVQHMASSSSLQMQLMDCSSCMASSKAATSLYPWLMKMPQMTFRANNNGGLADALHAMHLPSLSASYHPRSGSSSSLLSSLTTSSSPLFPLTPPSIDMILAFPLDTVDLVGVVLSPDDHVSLLNALDPSSTRSVRLDSCQIKSSMVEQCSSRYAALIASPSFVSLSLCDNLLSPETLTAIVLPALRKRASSALPISVLMYGNPGFQSSHFLQLRAAATHTPQEVADLDECDSFSRPNGEARDDVAEGARNDDGDEDDDEDGDSDDDDDDNDVSVVLKADSPRPPESVVRVRLHNSLSPDQCTDICSTLATTVTRLIVSGITFPSPPAAFFVTVSSRLTNLTNLRVSSCQISSLPPLSFPNLQRLDLSCNALTDEGLPSTISCPKLRWMSLEGNPLNHVDRLSNLLPSLSSLRHLCLRNTKLSQAVQLVATLPKCASLRSLDLDDNPSLPRQTIIAASRMTSSRTASSPRNASQQSPVRRTTAPLVPRQLPRPAPMSVHDIATKWGIGGAQTQQQQQQFDQQLKKQEDEYATLLQLYNELLAQHAEVCLAYDAAIPKAAKLGLTLIPLQQIKARVTPSLSRK